MPVTPADEIRDRSLTATARRAQIIAATIETIAELGYGQASFGRIAERAGLSSTRLISYHFADKQELLLAGQRSGEFRAFDTAVVATSIQRTIEGVPMLCESRPDLDFAACARELVTVFELATRNPA
jgi:hypothetical protein